MHYTDESGILTAKGEEPKILAVYDRKTEVYRVHRNPFCGGTWYMSSYTLPFSQIDLRTNDLELAKKRAEKRYREYKAA